MVKGEGEIFTSAEEGIKASYAAGVHDEFVVPFRVVKGTKAGAAAGNLKVEAASRIRKNDSVIFSISVRIGQEK